MTQAAQITAVLVLYGQSPAQSASFCSLLEAMASDSDRAHQISLVIYDNSPQPHALPASAFTMHYIHDPANPGLAGAYNAALDQAKANGSTWLLLLDQDTRLSREYLAELLEVSESVQSETQIGAIVPKLWAGPRLYSPSAPFLRQIRRQFSNKHDTVDEHVSGVVADALTAYNSGAVVRVSAMEDIGGFPEDFWLDYLDHTVFEQLHRRGYRVWVMRTVLLQNLSHLDLNSVPRWRHWSVLAAQTRYVLRFGKTADRLFFRWWLLKTSRNYLSHCRDKRIWRMRAAQAFLLRQMPPRYPEKHGE